MFKSIFKEMCGSASSRRQIVRCCPAPPSLAFERLSPLGIRSPLTAELGTGSPCTLPTSQIFGKCSAAPERERDCPFPFRRLHPPGLREGEAGGSRPDPAPPSSYGFLAKSGESCLKTAPVGLANLGAGTAGGLSSGAWQCPRRTRERRSARLAVQPAAAARCAAGKSQTA